MFTRQVFEVQWIRVSLLAAGIITSIWLLQPAASNSVVEKGVQEIHYMGGGPIEGSLEEAVKAFERESKERHLRDPSYPVYKVISGQSASANQTEDPTRFVVSLAGGSPPDVISFDRYAVTEWASRGAFLPLDDLIRSDQQAEHPDAIRAADFYTAAWEEACYRDPGTGTKSVYAIPTGIDNRALFYNKDLLVRSGYVDEQGEARPPRTWEELEEMAIRLSEVRNGKLERVGYVPNFGHTSLYMYSFMNGGSYLSEDGKSITLADQVNVEALTYMQRIYDRLGGARRVYAYQSSFQGGDLDPFITGKIAMKVDGYWNLPFTLVPFGEHLNYGVAPPPVPAARLKDGPVSWCGGWAYAIPATARNKKGAWELIRYLSTSRAALIQAEDQRQWAESKGEVFVPHQQSNRLINEELIKRYVDENPRIDKKVRDAVRMFTDLLPHSKYRPVTPVGQLLWNQQVGAMEEALFHKATPEQALAGAERIVQRELDLILNPQVGEPIDWSPFLWIYGVLLIIAAGAIVGTDLYRNRRFPQAHRDWWAGTICASPWIVGFVVFTGGPILFSIIISFCEYDVLHNPRWIGGTNYKWIFHEDPLFWKSLWNTAYMMLGVPLGMAAGLAIALLLNTKVKGLPVWRTLFYLPAIVPAVAASILWIWIFNPHAGLLNQFLGMLGFDGLHWLQDANTSKPSLIIKGLWGAGGGMIIWLAGLKAINESYYEAAEIDGANGWQRFRYITLPLLSPYIFFNLIMGIIGTFQIFTEAFIMTKGGPVNSTLFYVYHLFNNAFRYLKMGQAAAMAWVLFVIVLILTIWQMRSAKKWVHYEGGDE